MNKLKVIIQGVTRMSKELYLRSDNVFDIIAFVDRNKSKTETCFEDIPIYTDLSVITTLEYEFILVTAEDFCGIAREYHSKYQVPYEKMISMRHTHQYSKQVSFCAYANEIYRSGVSGAVAEVGVDYGDTAKYLNLFFNDRKLYLFDTFSGFDSQDIAFEQQKGTMVEVMKNFYDVRSTAEDVRSRMFYPENCILKPGYFPESVGDLEETFAFVHIDCDLQKPILSALEYFYPRLSPGGIISVHDYLSPFFPGVRKVVRDFSEAAKAEFQPNMMSGSAVFMKKYNTP